MMTMSAVEYKRREERRVAMAATKMELFARRRRRRHIRKPFGHTNVLGWEYLFSNCPIVFVLLDRKLREFKSFG